MLTDEHQRSTISLDKDSWVPEDSFRELQEDSMSDEDLGPGPCRHCKTLQAELRFCDEERHRALVRAERAEAEVERLKEELCSWHEGDNECCKLRHEAQIAREEALAEVERLKGLFIATCASRDAWIKQCDSADNRAEKAEAELAAAKREINRYQNALAAAVSDKAHAIAKLAAERASHAKTAKQFADEHSLAGSLEVKLRDLVTCCNAQTTRSKT